MSKHACSCVSKSEDSSQEVCECDGESTKSVFDFKQFLCSYLAVPLTSGLREMILRNPSDPIEFLAHWLVHFRDCEKRASELKSFEEELLLYRETLRQYEKEDYILQTYLDQSEQEGEEED